MPFVHRLYCVSVIQILSAILGCPYDVISGDRK